MKAKVLEAFRDKHTKENYEVDQVITVTKERFEEMNSTALGVLVEEIKEPKKPKKSRKK
ncbi:MAG: hypothetical protein WBL79_03110 [Bacillota bacterium]